MSKRNYEEASEKLQNVTNEAPADKYQNNQQVAPSTGLNSEVTSSGFVPKKEKGTGSKLKQEVASEVIHDSAVGGSNAGDGATFGGSRSSGGVGGVAGAANATPVAGKARGNDRITKKLDRNSTKLNYIPSDQALVEWDESKPLADSADADQGFNGTYRNEFARLQKNKEAVPGALMFDRSVDLITKDNIYFGEGQVVRQTGVNLQSDISQTAVPNTLGVYKYPESEATKNFSGGDVSNYLTREIDIQLSSTGAPVYVEYVESDLGVNVDAEVANKASVQDHILMNDAELVRETMDSKAGDEKAEIWTPLARAVRQPTALNGFLRDLEAEVGNELLTAYRKASTSMSFQLNRAHLDGQDTSNPGIEALTGLKYSYISKSAASTAQGTDMQSCFTPAHYRNGDASTMIALYDSVTKYNTKADVITQPRGLRMHLQTADNNIDPFFANKLFVNAYDNQEVFSTINRDWDPMSPTCLTDKAAVVHRLSWHRLGSYIQSNVTYGAYNKGSVPNGSQELTVLVPSHMVNELIAKHLNVYVVTPKDLNGNVDFDDNTFKPDSSFNFGGDTSPYVRVIIAATDAEATYDSSTEECVKAAYSSLTENGPIYWDGRSDGSHCYYLNSATINNNSAKIYPYQGGPLRYCYSDLRNNYVVTVEHPLLKGFDDYLCDSIGPKYNSLTNMRSSNTIAPINIRTVHSTMFFSLWSFLLCAAVPFIVKARINSMRDVLYYTKNVEYPYSSTLVSVRDVLTKSYTNFTYRDYDTELSTGIMHPATALGWLFPELYQQVGYESSESKVLMPWYTNQNEVRYLGGSYSFDDDASAMSFPSIRSGVRFEPLDSVYGMTEKDVRLSTDMVASFKALNPTLSKSRAYKYSTVGDGQLVLSVDPDVMTGYNILKLPRQMGFFITAPYGSLTPTYNHTYSLSTTVLGSSSFRCYYWFGPNATETGDGGAEAILQAVTINVNRAQNFRQTWYCVLASGTIPTYDHGFILSANQAFAQNGALLAGRTSFKPYASLQDEGTASTSNCNALRSLQKVMWTRIQKLPFVLSPFDGLTLDNTGTPNSTVICDPYDFLYYFGLGGFRASDYRESVYNREKEIVNQGITFVSDPWIESSPVFKEGSLSSGISVAKGFELSK